MESKQVLCCGAKQWSLVIGWVQAIFSGIGLVIFIINLIMYVVGASNDKNFKDDHSYGVVVVGILITISTLLIGLIAGIILIMGVKEENANKLRIWIIIEGIFLIFSVVSLVVGFFSGAWGGILTSVLTILASIFCIWVVNIHRHEVLNSGIGRVSYGMKV